MRLLLMKAGAATPAFFRFVWDIRSPPKQAAKQIYAQLGIQSIPNWAYRRFAVADEEDEQERLFRERVRDAIQAGGKSGVMSRKTGIPVGTLNKYVSLRSVPSAINALRIARAVGLSLEELSAGKKVHGAEGDSSNVIVEDEISYEVRKIDDDVDPLLMERLYIAVEQLYKRLGQRAPGHRIANEATALLNALKQRIGNVSDAPIVEAVIPVLLKELEERLASAATEPGSGKRSAS